MNTSPLVSVIVIFLNEQRFLREAIDSVYEQSFRDWELILVDDGSKDASTSIALGSVSRYPEKVLYLEHPGHENRGMSASRNLGIRHAKGEYVTFLDADDIWLPPKLEKQLPVLETEPEAGLVYGLDQYWYSWTGQSGYERDDFVPALGIQPYELIRPPGLLPLFLRGRAAIPCPTNIMVRRSTFEKVGCFEESFRGAYEDQAFYSKALLKVNVLATDQCWTKYRQHPCANTALTQESGLLNSTRRFFLQWLQAFLKEERVTHVGVWEALNKELWLSTQFNLLPDSPFSDQTNSLFRRAKKWILKLEEGILPTAASHRLWGGRQSASVD